MSFMPHTEADIQAMLGEIGVQDIQALFAEIPDALLVKKDLDLPASLKELQVTQLMQQKANQDAGYQSYLGAGAYEHHIPAAIWELVSRGEFYTAYTPYQAEASQGGLQLIYEYQTMIANLTGMDVSNASLYDGANALAEAIFMAVRANKKAKSQRVLCLSGIHPYYKSTVETITHLQGIEIEELAYDKQTGCADLAAITASEQQAAVLVIQQPNFFGCLEDVDQLVNWAHRNGILVIAAVNPTSLALLKEPGAWGDQGADIVCGEGQPLGIPLSSGGPYFGFLACKQALVREMPGRIVGRTVDMDGKEGFTLTLQAREQHIRRAKAKSNVCTNQGLMVVAATIYMSLLGPEGLRRVALASHHNTHELVKQLTQLPGVSLAFNAPYFHEAVLQFEQPVAEIISYCQQQGILIGLDLQQFHSELPNTLLVCVTETKTEEDLARAVAVVKQALSKNLSQQKSPVGI